MSDSINLAVPFFSQRSNRAKNTSKKTMAWDTCNLTSLCMILNYLGITDDTPDVLIKKFLEKKYGNHDYTNWDNLQAACKDIYNIDSVLILYDEYKIDGEGKFEHANLSKYLKAGFPIMFSFGILSEKDKKGKRELSGHIAVLRGMTEKGDWILNDPWGDPANAHGLLNDVTGVQGIYVARSEDADITAGKGSGDNAIISKNELSKVCKNPFHAAMCILWARQWSFFLRDGSGKRIRFGDDEHKQTLSKIQNILSSSLDFILTENGSIKRGLSLSSASGKNVYSCGPGRIIAIKNSADIASNFILVMHSLPGNPKEKVFMLYKGLSYIELDKKIKEGIYNSENFAKTWYDQLINKIHTKAVIYDKGIEATGAQHATGLPERGIAYLVPQNKDVRNFAEHIKPNVMPTGMECAKINDINNYKINDGKKVLFEIRNDEEGIAEIKEVEFENSKLVPQTVNDKEYFYYRAKLAQLLSGETVLFLGEDDDTISNPAKSERKILPAETFGSIFFEVLKGVFPDIHLENSEYEKAKYGKYLDKVIDVYQEKFKQFQNSKDSAALKALGKDFITKCRLLCRKLLETPWTVQTAAFSSSDKWYKGEENGSFTGLKQVYEEMYRFFQSVKGRYDFETTWTMFQESVKYFYPANMDFFIEATSGTVLGEATSYTSVECFSVDNVFKDQEDMKILDLENIYNKSSVVSTLKESGYISDEDFKWLLFNYVRKKEVNNFHNKHPAKDLEYILYIPNPLKEISQKEQENIVDDAIGNMECSKEEREEVESMFPTLFDKELLALLKKYNDIDLSRDKLYFYNPVRMISHLYELHNKVYNELKRTIG